MVALPTGLFLSFWKSKVGIQVQVLLYQYCG
jgi:hypothetical protein